ALMTAIMPRDSKGDSVEGFIGHSPAVRPYDAGAINGAAVEKGRRKFSLKPFDFKNGINEEYLLNELGVSLGVIYSSVGKLQSVNRNIKFDS
ncbi:hypothetical protein ACJ8IN_20820, partial [Serratia sp. CY31944]|uniref:hypothetical protein n=1 Tax=Serratia sp. CY31944 TaxID=3383598 RepID=UPI003FA15FEF